MPDAELAAFFVYGTLMQGQRNFRAYAGDARSAIPATVTGSLYHLPAGYPILVDEGARRVVGQILAFPNPAKTLRTFDALEEYDPDRADGAFYVRTVCEATPIGGVVAMACWTYVVPPEQFQRVRARAVPVPNGDWAAFVRTARA